MSKRQRPDEPSQDIEQRLTNLIAKIGDKNVANLTTHIEGLAKALEGDLPKHSELRVSRELHGVYAFCRLV